MYIEHVYLSLLDPISVSSTLWGGRVWDKGRLAFLTFGNVLAGFLILDDSYRGARKWFSFATYARGLVQKLKAVCANTPASHTPLPHQVVPLEHFCVGRSSCCTVALTHPQIIEQPWGPDPVVQQWCCFHCPRGQLCLSQGRVWFQRAKTTADTWLGGSPISYLFKNEMLLLLVFVCLLACFFHFMKNFHPSFLLFSWSESNWHTEIGQQFSSLFSEAILLACSLLMRYPREVSGKSLGFHLSL